MKKLFFILCFIDFLLTGCKNDGIDSTYKEFINSDYYKGELSVTI